MTGDTSTSGGCLLSRITYLQCFSCMSSFRFYNAILSEAHAQVVIYTIVAFDAYVSLNLYHPWYPWYHNAANNLAINDVALAIHITHGTLWWLQNYVLAMSKHPLRHWCFSFQTSMLHRVFYILHNTCLPSQLQILFWSWMLLHTFFIPHRPVIWGKDDVYPTIYWKVCRSKMPSCFAVYGIGFTCYHFTQFLYTCVQMFGRHPMRPFHIR